MILCKGHLLSIYKNTSSLGVHFNKCLREATIANGYKFFLFNEDLSIMKLSLIEDPAFHCINLYGNSAEPLCWWQTGQNIGMGKQFIKYNPAIVLFSKLIRPANVGGRTMFFHGKLEDNGIITLSHLEKGKGVN